MIPEIKSAFASVRDGYPPDRVIADPEFNAKFLAECRQLGLTETDFELNRALLNLRKRSQLTDYRATRRTSFKNESEYRFACEISARLIERRDGISIDDLICDPLKAAEFDQLAMRIAPGQTPLQYRWAALNLRKARKLHPEILGDVVASQSVTIVPVDELVLKDVTTGQGLYIFYEEKQTLYVGEAANLFVRVKKHLDHSDNKELARWFWGNGTKRVFLELHSLPPDTSTKVRKAVEAELICSRKPLFNVQVLPN